MENRKEVQATLAAAREIETDSEKILKCIADQGRFHNGFGRVVICTRCGRHMQAFHQCMCGAP